MVVNAINANGIKTGYAIYSPLRTARLARVAAVRRINAQNRANNAANNNARLNAQQVQGFANFNANYNAGM